MYATDKWIDRLGWVYALTFVVIFLLMLACVSAYRISRATHEPTPPAWAAEATRPPARRRGGGLTSRRIGMDCPRASLTNASCRS